MPDRKAVYPEGQEEIALRWTVVSTGEIIRQKQVCRLQLQSRPISLHDHGIEGRGIMHCGMWGSSGSCRLADGSAAAKPRDGVTHNLPMVTSASTLSGGSSDCGYSCCRS